jgi:hypothetical protein
METKNRRARETIAKGLIDGRTRKKGERNEQLNLRTTVAKKQQMQRLATATGKTQVEIIEEAIDLFEAHLEKSAQKGAA